jgi:hypothetical protein
VVILGGAVLLGWIAGKVIAADSVTMALISQHWDHAEALHTAELVLATAGAAVIFVTGLVMRSRQKAGAA